MPVQLPGSKAALPHAFYPVFQLLKGEILDEDHVRLQEV